MHCTINECENIAHCRGMCHKHYKRMQRKTQSYIDKYGIHNSRNIIINPLTKDNIFTVIDKRTLITEGCWIWNGERTNTNYARFRYGGKTYRLHRLMYRLFIKEPRSDLVLDHLCEVKLCINPFHLEEVTIGENIRRYWANRKERRNV